MSTGFEKVIAVVAAIAAVIAAIAAAGAGIFAFIANEHSAQAQKDARAQIYSAARSEIVSYAVRMVSLDRLGASRNGNQVDVLGQQSQAVIETYGQSNLQLSPAAYRVIAQYLALDTDDIALATTLSDTALATAKAKGDSLEEIRAYRVIADLAAQSGHVSDMKAAYSSALQISKEYEKDQVGYAAIHKTAAQYTRGFAVYTALLAEADDGAGACKAARSYTSDARVDLTELDQIGSLEMGRRAVRIDTKKLCGLTSKQLHLERFTSIWNLRDKTTGG